MEINSKTILICQQIKYIKNQYNIVGIVSRLKNITNMMNALTTNEYGQINSAVVVWMSSILLI